MIRETCLLGMSTETRMRGIKHGRWRWKQARDESLKSHKGSSLDVHRGESLEASRYLCVCGMLVLGGGDSATVLTLLVQRDGYHLTHTGVDHFRREPWVPLWARRWARCMRAMR